MKLGKKIVGAALCVCCAFSGAACGGKTTEVNETLEGTLRISVYDGSYGTEWISNLAAKFEAAYDNVIVNVTPDVGLLTTLAANLEDENAKYDMYFSHGIPWELYATQQLLENLDDLYASEVSEGVTFADRVEPKALAASNYGKHYYKAPWTRGAGGFVYNVKMFEDNGWKVPSTYAELTELCETIAAAGVKVQVGGETKTVTPFVWPGVDEWLWDYVFYEWWGQLAGTEKIESFLKYDDKEKFNPDTQNAEFKKAYAYWYDLVAANPSYSFEGCASLNKYDALTRFTSGCAAMMPNAHWIYNDVKKIASGFEMAMFNAPTLPDAKPGYEKVNFSVGFGDSAIVSRKAKNKALAKEFLRFMSLEENCVAFSEDVPGTALAYNYDFQAAADQNTFAASISRIHTENVSFNIYSNAKLAIKLGSEIIGPWTNNTFYYKQSYLNSAKYTPATVVGYVYTDVTDNWASWQRALND